MDLFILEWLCMRSDAQQAQLLENLRAGGQLREAAISTLYKELFAPLMAHLYGLGCPPHKAEDCVQEGFIKVLRNIDQFRGEAKLSTWIFTIVENVWHDMRRSAYEAKSADLESSGVEHIEDDPARNASQQIEHKDLVDCFHRGFALYRAKYPDRAALLYRLEEGTSIDQLAAEEGRSNAAMREYLSQCRKKLAPFIAHCVALL